MKKSIENITTIFRLATFCLFTGLTTMSFTLSNETAATCTETFDYCPTPNFSVINNGCIGSCEITFVNQSLNATSYEWDFGDGNTSTEENPRHTYQVAGSYSVKLTAIIDGCAVPFIGTVDIVGS